MENKTAASAPTVGEREMIHQDQDPSNAMHQLEEAIGFVEMVAQTEEGREGLAEQGGRFIECQRRLYALAWALSLVVKERAA